MTRKKYLLATALLALCISLAAGMASAQVGWVVADQDLPGDIAWDVGYDASVDVEITGTGTVPADSHALVSVEGITGAAVAIDRWGRTESDTVPFTMINGQVFALAFGITGPAITTLQYEAPVGITAPGLPLSVDCNWIYADVTGATPSFLLDDTAVQDTVVSRFPDVGQAVVGWYYIEQLAGRVPLVVKGYPNGTYGPAITVDREQMAIFMARALNLPLLPHVGTFADVPDTMVGAQYIEALALANIVSGFSPTVYGPAGVVTREQMAIFVSRGMAGGDGNVPSGPAVATFTDVATGAVSYRYVEYCVAAEVVTGYSATIYGPTVDVTREQMAIFIWRGFIRPSGSAVVLGGPAMTDVQPDPAVVGYLGWTSQHADPQYAYVVFDAVRLGANLIYPVTPSGTWDVRFEVRAASDPQGAAVASDTKSLDATDIQNAIAAAASNDDPYHVVYWDLSGEALGVGDYILVVLVEDDTGAMHEAGWKPVEASYVDRFFGFTVS